MIVGGVLVTEFRTDLRYRLAETNAHFGLRTAHIRQNTHAPLQFSAKVENHIRSSNKFCKFSRFQADLKRFRRKQHLFLHDSFCLHDPDGENMFHTHSCNGCNFRLSDFFSFIFPIIAQNLFFVNLRKAKFFEIFSFPAFLPEIGENTKKVRISAPFLYRFLQIIGILNGFFALFGRARITAVHVIGRTHDL